MAPRRRIAGAPCSSTGSPARRRSCAGSARCLPRRVSGATRPCCPATARRPHELERTRWQDWAACVGAAFDDLARECRRRRGRRSVDGWRRSPCTSPRTTFASARSRRLAAPIWLSGPLPAAAPAHQAMSSAGTAQATTSTSGTPTPSRSCTATAPPDAQHRRAPPSLRSGAQRAAPQVRAPVLVIHGERDRSIDPRCAHEIARRLVASEAVQPAHAAAQRPRDLRGRRPRRGECRAIVHWFERFAPGVAARLPRREVTQPESRVDSRRRAAMLRIDHRIRRGARVEVAMTFRSCGAASPAGAARAASRTTSPHAAQRSTAAAVPLPAYSRWENRKLTTAARAAPPWLASRQWRRCSSTQAYDGECRWAAGRGVTGVDRRPSARGGAHARLLVAGCAAGLRPHRSCCSATPTTPGVPLLFVLRSTELRQHPGQIAFPGGRRRAR